MELSLLRVLGILLIFIAVDYGRNEKELSNKNYIVTRLLVILAYIILSLHLIVKT